MSLSYAILLNTVSQAALNGIARSGSIVTDTVYTTMVVGKSVANDEIRVDHQAMNFVLGKTVLNNEIRVDHEHLTLVLAA